MSITISQKISEMKIKQERGTHANQSGRTWAWASAIGLIYIQLHSRWTFSGTLRIGQPQVHEGKKSSIGLLELDSAWLSIFPVV
jgi:hypothetical protein